MMGGKDDADQKASRRHPPEKSGQASGRELPERLRVIVARIARTRLWVLSAITVPMTQEIAVASN
jgi:hypothetical protein